jgi:hypothetical protein
MIGRLCLALLILSAATACSSTDYRMDSRPMYGGATGGATGRTPALDPNRKISEQDCSKPVVLDEGNLRCK